MGSKMQAVGSALALAARLEISLVYARPERFNPSSYSGGIGVMREIRFEMLETVISSLASVGQMIVVCADGTEEF